jgi:hypothetical protein
MDANGSPQKAAIAPATPPTLLSSAIRSGGGASAARNAPVQTAAPYLVEGRWTFRDLRRRECGFSVMAKGFGTGQMTWGGLKPGLYHVRVRNAKVSIWDDEAEVGEDGRLALTADADATSPLDIDVACIEGDN